MRLEIKNITMEVIFFVLHENPGKGAERKQGHGDRSGVANVVLRVAGLLSWGC